jgi:hypothetical protein
VSHYSRVLGNCWDAFRAQKILLRRLHAANDTPARAVTANKSVPGSGTAVIGKSERSNRTNEGEFYRE